MLLKKKENGKKNNMPVVFYDKVNDAMLVCYGLLTELSNFSGDEVSFISISLNELNQLEKEGELECLGLL